MSLMTFDQPLKPNVLRVLVFPNFTRSTELPLEVGGGDVEEATVTVADWLTEPPPPKQVSVNVVLAVRFPVVCEPEIAFVPDHPPDAVHEVALVVLQVSVEAVPEVIEPGLADKATVGPGVEGGGATEPEACL